MKKMIAMVLAAILLLSLAACGSINDAEVAILWSGDGQVLVPNSLINSMERAMYIESIAYTHYGANGDQAAQTKQANDALNAGCAALVVELVDPAAAQEIVDAAKAKNIPVVFFNCQVDDAVVASYEKAACVVSDEASVGKVQSEQILNGITEEKKEAHSFTIDRNEDGKITYLGIGDVSATVDALNALLTENGLSPLESAVEGAEASVISGLTVAEGAGAKDKAQLLTAEGASVELIITSDDATAQETLKALQAHGFNSTKLTTHCIPLYTIGNETDAKSFLDQESYEAEEWAVLLYTTSDLIGSGMITGAAVVDYDSLAVSVSAVVRNLLKGSDTFANIADENVYGSTVKVPYTTN